MCHLSKRELPFTGTTLLALAGDGVLPGLALDLRPAPARGVSRQPGAAGLPPSGLPRPPLRPHLQQQQSRLTPVAALGSKQARAASVEPGAGGRLAAAGQQAVQPMDAEEAAGGGVGQRSASPMEVAEPSQQLGLSPGAAELQTAPQQQAGASPDAADAGAAVSPPAATPALGDAAGAGAAPAKKRDMSSPAADWHCLHHSARQLVEEVLQADPASPGYAAGEYVLTAEQAEARYTRVVSMLCASLLRDCGSAVVVCAVRQPLPFAAKLLVRLICALFLLGLLCCAVRAQHAAAAGDSGQGQWLAH